MKPHDLKNRDKIRAKRRGKRRAIQNQTEEGEKTIKY
jgi:hypothetical protein